MSALVPGVWILAPQDAVKEVEAGMTSSGWRVVAGAGQERTFERAAGERATLSFEPATQLRVLEFASVDGQVGDVEFAPVPRRRLREWLAAESEHIVLRGVLAAERTRDVSLLPWVESKGAHPAAAVAEAAARCTRLLRAGLDRETADEHHALRAMRFTGASEARPDVVLPEALDRRALDGSLQSLGAVDAYLLAIHALTLSESDFSNAVIRAGSYVGEVLRRASERELHWMFIDDFQREFPSFRTPSTTALLVDPAGEGAAPLHLVALRIDRGPSEPTVSELAAAVLHTTRKRRSMRLGKRQPSEEEQRATRVMLEPSLLDVRERRKRTEARLVLNPKLTFKELAAALTGIDFELTSPTAEPEPRAATFVGDRDRIEYAHEPALRLRTLVLHGSDVEVLKNDLVNVAYLSTLWDFGGLLESKDRAEVLLGLAAIRFLHGPAAAQRHAAELAPLRDHADPEVRAAARAL